MNIAASEIPQHIHPDAVAVSLRAQDGEPCAEITIEDLKALVANDHVTGVVRRGKLREIRLTVPVDVAKGGLGEVHRKISGQFRTDANTTTVRASDTLPNFYKDHHRLHCGLWVVPEKPTEKHWSISRDYAPGPNGNYRYTTDEVRAKHHIDGTELYHALALTNTPHRTDQHYVAPGDNPTHRDRRPAETPIQSDLVRQQTPARIAARSIFPDWVERYYSDPYLHQTNTYFFIAENGRFPKPGREERLFDGSDAKGAYTELMALRAANPDVKYQMIERLR